MNNCCGGTKALTTMVVHTQAAVLCRALSMHTALHTSLRIVQSDIEEKSLFWRWAP